MNIDTQPIEPCQLKLTVEVDAERLQRANFLFGFALLCLGRWPNHSSHHFDWSCCLLG